jgi:hypothetical protein
MALPKEDWALRPAERSCWRMSASFAAENTAPLSVRCRQNPAVAGRRPERWTVTGSFDGRTWRSAPTCACGMFQEFALFPHLM